MIHSQGLTLALVGFGCGALVAAGATQLMRSALYGISPTDPITYLGVAGLLVVVSLLACQVPAWRAMKVDPLVALRRE